MSNLTTPQARQLSEQTRQARNAFWISLLAFLTFASSAVLYFILAANLVGTNRIWRDAWQVYGLAFLQGLLAVICLASAWLSKRRRHQLGIGVLLVSIMIALPFIPTLVADLGLVIGLTFVLATVLVVRVTVSGKQASWLIAGAIVSALLTLIIDQFWPQLGLWERAQLPAANIFVPVLSGVLLLTLAFLLIRQFPHFSLRIKLIVTFIFVALFPIALLTLLSNQITRANLIDEANNTLTVAAKQTASSFDTFINNNLDAVKTEARFPDLVEYLSLPLEERNGSAEQEQALTTLRSLGNKSQAYISSYALLDSEGVNVLDTNPAAIGLYEYNRSYFQEPFTTDKPYASNMELSETTNEPAIFFSAPVHSDSGEFLGVLRLTLNAAVLQELIEKNSALIGEDSFTVLFDEHLIHLAHSTAPETIFKAVGVLDQELISELQLAQRLPLAPAVDLYEDLPELEQNLKNVINNPNVPPFFTAKDAATGEAINQVTVAPLESETWYITVFQPQDTFLTLANAQTRATLPIAVFIAVIVTAIAVALGQYLANPIIRLTGVAIEVAAGALEVQVPVDSDDEIGQLGAAFNRMTAQLRRLIGSLESQVEARTAELTLSMEVGQRAAAIRVLEELLPTMTEFIRVQFDLYYTQVYFVDDVRRSLVLVSGTGEVGEALLSRQHSLQMGAGSIVGRAASEARAIVVPDTEQSSFHKYNPLLPNTRSELAVPLIIEGQVIGVLDMQAQEANAFTDNNVPVFEVMGTQLAVSIDSAQQWAVGQTAQQKAEEAIKQLTRQTWQEEITSLSGRKSIGYAYNLSTVSPLNQPSSGNGQTTGEEAVVVPVQVQNQEIGRFTVEQHGNRQLSEDEQILLNAVSDQLAQKVENIRLFEDTQRRATREELTRQITDRIRASSNIETALQTAAAELTKVLKVDRAVIELNVAASTDQQEEK